MEENVSHDSRPNTAPQIGAVIFDLDGTLIDSEPLYESVDQEFLLGKGVLVPDADWSSVVGMGGRAFLSSIKEKHDLAEPVDQLLAEKDELYLTRATSIETFPRVVALVHFLFVHGVPIAVATSSGRHVLDAMMNVADLSRYFNVTLSSDDVRHGKPDPEIFLRAAGELGVPASDCLVLEDSRYGVRAARAAGMHVVALPAIGQDLGEYGDPDMLVEGGAAKVDPDALTSAFGLANARLSNRLPDEATRTRFRTVVYDFAARNPRPMPWRETHDPYKILVSEFMLQQTQVARVVHKYHEFLHRFPDVGTLANASLGDVLELWQGLGYNRRAKNLVGAAQRIATDFHGSVPEDDDDLRSLPGVGAYTAAAVRAFAFSKSVIVLETNIRRVILHYFFPTEEGVEDSRISEVIQAVVDEKDPRAWYYALMDYGSYLGRILPNSNRRAASYTTQSRFEGSLRQIRGAILRELSESRPQRREELERRLEPTDKRLGQAMQALLREGLIVERQGYLDLP